MEEKKEFKKDQKRKEDRCLRRATEKGRCRNAPPLFSPPFSGIFPFLGFQKFAHHIAGKLQIGHFPPFHVGLFPDGDPLAQRYLGQNRRFQRGLFAEIHRAAAFRRYLCAGLARLRVSGGVIDGFQIPGPLPAGQPVVDPHLGRGGVDDLKRLYADHQPDMVEILRQIRVVIRAAGLVFALHPTQVGAAFENRHARFQPGGGGHTLHLPAVDAGDPVGAVVDTLPKLAVGVHKRPGAVDPLGVAGAGSDIGPAQHGVKHLNQFSNGNHGASHPA